MGASKKDKNKKTLYPNSRSYEMVNCLPLQTLTSPWLPYLISLILKPAIRFAENEKGVDSDGKIMRGLIVSEYRSLQQSHVDQSKPILHYLC